MHRERLIPLTVLFASLGYALARYVLWGGISLAQVPLFVANKAIAVSGLIMIGLASMTAGTRRRSFGTTGFLLVLLHVVLSLTILNPAYFSNLYTAKGYLLGRAEASFLAGSVALVLLYRLSIAPATAVRDGSLIPGAGQFVLVLTGYHALALGYPTWTAPASWPGSLPPITMLSFLIASLFLVVRRIWPPAGRVVIDPGER